jgi:hypothetical protein
MRSRWVLKRCAGIGSRHLYYLVRQVGSVSHWVGTNLKMSVAEADELERALLFLNRTEQAMRSQISQILNGYEAAPEQTNDTIAACLGVDPTTTKPILDGYRSGLAYAQGYRLSEDQGMAASEARTRALDSLMACAEAQIDGLRKAA